jgi:hypothetical protein
MFLGSTGCQPVAFGRRAERIYLKQPQSVEIGSRQAAANYRLAACAPQKNTAFDNRRVQVARKSTRRRDGANHIL